MKMSDLFQTVPKGSRPSAPLLGQFEFRIDRRGRKVAGGFSGLLNSPETVRVTTDRPFTWTGKAVLPDTSLGLLREIRCEVEAQGAIPPSEADARGVLTLVLQDDFDFDRLFQRHLVPAIAAEGTLLSGNFIDKLRADGAGLQRSVAERLRRSGLPVANVVIRAISYDARRRTLDIDDRGMALEVRTKGQLQVQRITFRARLEWGGKPEHLLAMVSYEGAVEGREPIARLVRPLETGQLQPLEAWFRHLLAEAVSQETGEDIRAGDAAMLDRVGERISGPLGRGTGRVVATLVLYPVLSNTQTENERSIRFKQNYSVIGVQGDRLGMEHVIKFRLAQNDRWVAQNSPEPEAYIRREIVEATKLFLDNRRFEDVVQLYMSKPNQEEFNRDVEKRVKPIAAAIGFDLVSTVAILSIPEHDFIDGRDFELPEDSYQLSEPHLQPRMRLTFSVAVADGARFAQALARQGAIAQRIEMAVNQEARKALLGCNGLDYYGSPYVNGLSRVSGAGASGDGILQADPFDDMLRTRLDAVLSERFGLALVHLGIVAGPDPRIARMREVAKLSLRFDQREDIARGPGRGPVSMEASGTVFIDGIERTQWSAFYYGVERFDSVNALGNEIKAMLAHALRMMVEQVATSPNVSGPGPDGLRDQVLEHFVRRVREEYGLDARLHPFSIRIEIPQTDRSRPFMIEALEQEIRNILEQRSALRDTTMQDAKAERARLTERLAEARNELRQVSDEHDNETGRTITINMPQPMGSKRLE